MNAPRFLVRFHIEVQYRWDRSGEWHRIMEPVLDPGTARRLMASALEKSDHTAARIIRQTISETVDHEMEKPVEIDIPALI